jgi:hypothetical protein
MYCYGGESAIEQVYVAYRGKQYIACCYVVVMQMDGFVVEAGLVGVHFFECGMMRS